MKSERLLRLWPSGDLPWALSLVVDQHLQAGDIAVLQGPLSLEEETTHAAFLSAHRMVGFTHSGVFPLLHPALELEEPSGSAFEGWERESVRACEGWAHCFREPDLYLPPDRPRILLSESDWTDHNTVRAAAYKRGVPGKRWDAICVCAPHPHPAARKNWELALACIPRLCRDLGLRVLIVGRAGTSELPDEAGVEVWPEVPWHALLTCVARSRIAFFPNALDPSPRLLGEALCLDVPVLVNRAILGGWKYVTRSTGTFFDGEHDVVEAARRCLSRSYAPRAWFTANYGPVNSGRRLAAFVDQL